MDTYKERSENLICSCPGICMGYTEALSYTEVGGGAYYEIGKISHKI